MKLFKEAPAKPKFKGRKMYAVANPTNGHVIILKDTIDEAIEALDLTWTVVVELTITRAFARERALNEIETEPL